MRNPRRNRFIRHHWASIAALVAFALAFTFSGLASAQSSCASDGQPRPFALLERFINADCGTCWGDPGTPKPPAGGIALDWVLPGSQADDAPLSAVALRDAAQRLESLGKKAPPSSVAYLQPQSTIGGALQQPKPNHGLRVRVARGIALNGYMGASIDVHMPVRAKPALPDFRYPLTAWLVLTETIPAGVEDSPVERELARNSLTVTWQLPTLDAKNRHSAGPYRHFESRPMSLPEGVNPDRVNVVGWVQDAQGRLLVSARSVCSR